MKSVKKQIWDKVKFQVAERSSNSIDYQVNGQVWIKASDDVWDQVGDEARDQVIFQILYMFGGPIG